MKRQLERRTALVTGDGQGVSQGRTRDRPSRGSTAADAMAARSVKPFGRPNDMVSSLSKKFPKRFKIYADTGSEAIWALSHTAAVECGGRINGVAWRHKVKD